MRQAFTAMVEVPRGALEDYRTSTDLLNRSIAAATIDEREEARRQLAQRRTRGRDVRGVFGLVGRARGVAGDVALNALLRNQTIAGATIDQRELARNTLAQREAAGLTLGGAVGRTGAAAVQRFSALQSGIGQRIGQSASMFRELARGSQGIGRGATAAIVAQIMAQRALVGVGAAVRGMAARMRLMGAALLAALGPLDLLLLAAIGISYAAGKYREGEDRLVRRLQAASNVPTSGRGVGVARTAARQLASRDRDFNDVLNDFVANLRDPLHLIGHPFHPSRPATDRRRATGRQDLANIAAEQRRRGLARANAADALGDPTEQGGLYAEDIREIARSNKTLLEQGRITPEEFRRRMKYLIGVARASDQPKAGRDTQITHIRQDMLAHATGTNYTRDLLAGGLAGIDAATLTDTQQGLGGLIELGDASQTITQRFAENAVALAAKFRGSGTDAGRQAYAQARQSYQTIQQGAQTQLERGLLLARGQDERNAAYNQYQRSLTAPLAGPRSMLRELDRQRRGVLGQMRDQDMPDPRVDPQGARTAIARRGPLRQRLADIERQRRAIQAEINNYTDENRDALRQIHEARWEEGQALAEARAGTAAARTDAGGPRIARQLAANARQLAAYIRHYGRDSKEVEGVIQEGIQLRDEAVQEAMAGLEAQSAMNVAQASTPAGERAAEITGMRQRLRFMQTHRRTYKASEIADQAANIVAQQKADRQATEEEAIAALNARYDVLEASMDPGDTVAIARKEAERAQRLYARGNFRTDADRLGALANRDRTRAELARSRQQASYDQIEFQASIGQLGHDAELQALRRLERTVRHNKSLRQTIKQRIYQLTHEDEQDNELTIGNVRVPSLYEVRRAVAGGSRNLTQLNQNRVEVHVHGPQDYDALGRVLETHVSGSGRSLARAGGMR